MTDSKGLFPLPQYRKPVKKMSNGRRAIIKELDALQKNGKQQYASHRDTATEYGGNRGIS